MFVTLVASLCMLGSPICVDEIVTDTSMDQSLTWQGCLVHGQLGVSAWMAQHPLFHAGYRLDRWKCVPGHYSLPGRA